MKKYKHWTGWHFSNGGINGYHDGRKITKSWQRFEPRPGGTLRRAPLPCIHGFHASRRITDALKYAPGCTLSLVQLRGKIDESEGDQAVAGERRVLIQFNAGLALLEFALWCFIRSVASFYHNLDSNASGVACVELAHTFGEHSDSALSVDGQIHCVPFSAVMHLERIGRECWGIRALAGALCNVGGSLHEFRSGNPPEGGNWIHEVARDSMEVSRMSLSHELYSNGRFHMRAGTRHGTFDSLGSSLYDAEAEDIERKLLLIVAGHARGHGHSY